MLNSLKCFQQTEIKDNYYEVFCLFIVSTDSMNYKYIAIVPQIQCILSDEFFTLQSLMLLYTWLNSRLKV